VTEAKTASVELPRDIPPAWANALMKWALQAPVIQSMIGQGVALLTFTGHKTGRRYTIPVSYYREGDTVTIITKRVRNWWRNFQDPADVELRLAGRLFSGTARTKTDAEDALDFMTDYLAKRPIDAKAYGLGKDEIVREKVARIIPGIVVIEIELAAAAQIV
jgi:hypothetical protein